MKGKRDQRPPIPGIKNPRKAEQDIVPDMWKYYGVLAIILLISFIVYFPVFHNGLLVWDDDSYIKNNPLIYSFNLKEIFSSYVLGNYHPVTILAFTTEYHFFGVNETGYHTVNLLLHLLNVILVFHAVFLVCKKAGVALVAALLFGIHPLHVESVAWVAELKDLLYTFFFLASYIFYLKYLKNQQKSFYIIALLLFLVSLLSKAMAASLPVVLVLTDYFMGRKISRTTILEKVPFFLLAIAFGVVAIIAQKSVAAISDISISTFPPRLIFATYSFITYLLKFLLPLNLSAYYPYPVMNGTDIPILYYAYVIFFLVLIASVIYSLRFSGKIFFGFGFYAATVFLVLQLLPVGNAIMADRYMYLPSVGLFYLAGEGIDFLLSKKLRLAAIILVSAFLVFFSVKTFARCSVWKNDIMLWNDVISQYQTIPMAYYNRGNVLAREKRNDEAFRDFNKAIELKPDFADAYYNRGTLLMNEKREDEAFKDFNKTIDLNHDYAGAYYNRSLIFINKKRNSEALLDLNKAIELKPDYADAYNNRGTLLLNEKKFEEAISDYTQVIAMNPAYAMAYFNRGLAEYLTDKKDPACVDMKKAASLGLQPAVEAMHQICQ